MTLNLKQLQLEDKSLSINSTILKAGDRILPNKYAFILSSTSCTKDSPLFTGTYSLMNAKMDSL